MTELHDVTSLYAGFTAQATRRPDAVAVTDGAVEVTYRELDVAAREYRTALAAHGVAPGDLVGISLSQGWEVAAAILAVLGHGCGYVPLDPGYPVDRLTHMVENSGVRVAFAAADRDVLPADVARLTRAAGQPAPARPMARPAGTPAYVIYTSGSTGVPKGVAIRESSVLCLFRSCANGLFEFGQDDAWAQFFSYSFDFSVWEMWGALLFGGRMVVVPAETARRPTALLEFLSTKRVTVLNLVPSYFKHLVRAYERHPAPLALRYIVFGGEELDRMSVRQWQGLRPAAEILVNMYGITETTVHSTYGVLTPEWVASDAGGTWIGSSLAHLRIALLAPDGSAVPDGDPGEIHIAGSAVAIGYYGRPDLTAERFRRLRLDGDDEYRTWYRSGDIARRLPDGTYEYLGRNDRQVNLRGFRIELGEVEVALRAEPPVREAIAVIEEVAGGESVLVVYVTVNDGQAGAGLAARLRRSCATRLPAHMVPNRVVVLTEMPLSPSGKLDRARLRAGRVGTKAKEVRT